MIEAGNWLNNPKWSELILVQTALDAQRFVRTIRPMPEPILLCEMRVTYDRKEDMVKDKNMATFFEIHSEVIPPLIENRMKWQLVIEAFIAADRRVEFPDEQARSIVG